MSERYRELERISRRPDQQDDLPMHERGVGPPRIKVWNGDWDSPSAPDDPVGDLDELERPSTRPEPL